MRWITVFSLLIAAVGMLAGCNFTQRVAGAINPDFVSLADRCAEVTRLALPTGDIEITNRTSENQGVSSLVARVEGVRRDLPVEGSQPRDVATECQFTNTVLTGFKWTKGGPTTPSAPQ
jgi:hypothetical protein